MNTKITKIVNSILTRPEMSLNSLGRDTFFSISPLEVADMVKSVNGERAEDFTVRNGFLYHKGNPVGRIACLQSKERWSEKTEVLEGAILARQGF